MHMSMTDCRRSHDKESLVRKVMEGKGLWELLFVCPLGLNWKKNLGRFKYFYKLVNNLNVIIEQNWHLLTLYWRTRREGISGKTRFTSAYWAVIYNSAVCIYPTWIGTRVDTFLIDTWLCKSTLGIYYTLWSTSRWGSHELRETRANSISIILSTYTVWSTRRRLTRVDIYNY